MILNTGVLNNCKAVKLVCWVFSEVLLPTSPSPLFYLEQTVEKIYVLFPIIQPESSLLYMMSSCMWLKATLLQFSRYVGYLRKGFTRINP